MLEFLLGFKCILKKLIEQKQEKVGEILKNFSLFIFGGVNFEPYRSKFENLIGRKVDSVELYPASEGFFAFQDRQNEKGMLLQLDSGIFMNSLKRILFLKTTPKDNPERCKNRSKLCHHHFYKRRSLGL